MNINDENKNIQLLRGIAIVAVLGFHAEESMSPNGYLGVDVFFLISGFLIIPRIETALKKKMLKEFFKKRFNRLAPALLFTLVATFPLILIFGSWNSHSDFVRQALYTLLLMGNIGAINISGDYFNPDSFRPLVHTWSLAVEEQIYFFLPLGMALSKKFLSYCSLGSFLLFIAQEFTSQRTSTILFYLPISRIWEFHLGYLIFCLRKNFSKILTNDRLCKYLLVLILLMPIHIPQIPTTLLILFLASIVILSKRHNGRFTELGVVFGYRAYSLYLLHMPLLYIAKFSPLSNSTNRIKESLLAMLATFVLAELSFRKIEFRLVKTFVKT